MAGLGSLGALAGGFSQGMNDAESNALKKLQLQAAKDSLAGEATAGNIMSEVYGGPTQQPAQPQQGGLQGLLGKLGSFLQGGGAQPSVAQPQQASPMVPQGTPQMAPQAPQQQPMPPRAQPMQPQGGAVAPTAGSAPPPPQQQDVQIPKSPGDVGRLTLSQLVQAARRVNPNMPPAQLMSAMEKIAPFMNAEALQQYRVINQQIAAGRATASASQAATNEEGRNARFSKGEEDKGARQDKSMANSENHFQTRLAMHEQQLASAKDAADKRAINMEARAAVTAHLSALRLKIDADKSLDDETRAQRQKEANAEADDARKRLDAALKAKGESEAPAEWKPTGAARGADGGKSSMRAGDAPAPPKAGDVLQGYKFKGGDPSVQANWEKAQ